MEWKLEKRQLKDLREWDKNPRLLTEKGLKDLKESLTKFGIAEPIVINTDGTICGGHGRKRALTEMGIEQVDCYIPERKLSDKQFEELNIRLNANIAGEWDFERLANEWDVDELIEWGMDLPDMTVEEPQEIEEDEIPEIPEEPKTKLGDIYLLGEHRVMCGDSTSIDAVEKLMNGEKADMVFTDPPYGMFLDADYSSMKNNLDFAKAKGFSGGKKYDNVIGDHDDFKAEFINNIFASFSYCKEVFLWGADYYTELLPDRNGGSWLVWDKRANNNDDISADESSDKMYGSCFELCWSKQRHKRDIVRIKWAGVFGTEQEFDRKRHHPTQKPIKLSAWFLEKYTEKCNLIADLFLGSGSTLIAAEQTDRKCYGMELDPRYVEVILDRWQNLTGESAILESTGQTFNEIKNEKR